MISMLGQFSITMFKMTTCIAYCQHLVAVCSKYPSASVIGIIKTHNLRFQESEALQAVFASHLCPNVLKAPARLAAYCPVIKCYQSFSFPSQPKGPGANFCN